MNQSLLEQLMDATEELGRARVKIRKLEDALKTERRVSAEYLREMAEMNEPEECDCIHAGPQQVVLARTFVGPIIIVVVFASIILGSLIGR